MAYIGSKPANKPVVASDLDPTVITGQTALATSPASTDEFLISDAGVLKRLDASLIGGTNTPAFAATISSNLSIANATTTTVVFDSEIFDSDGKYNTSTGKFTPTVAGKYFFQTNLIMGGMGDNDYFDWLLKKNGTAFSYSQLFSGAGSNNELGGTISGIVDLDTDDYVNVDVYQGTGSAQNIKLPSIIFSGFKIIT